MSIDQAFSLPSSSAEALLHVCFDQLLDPVILCHPTGKVLYTSPNALRQLQRQSPIDHFLADLSDSLKTGEQLADCWQQAIAGCDSGFDLTTVQTHCQFRFIAHLQLMVVQLESLLVDDSTLTALSVMETVGLAIAVVNQSSLVLKATSQFWSLIEADRQQPVWLSQLLVANDFWLAVKAGISQQQPFQTYRVERSVQFGDRLAWLRVTIAQVPGASENRLWIQFEDITLDKNLQLAWKELGNKWNAFATQSNNLFLIADEAGKIIDTTPVVQRILGYGAEALLNHYLIDLIHPDDLNDFDLTYRLWINKIEPAKTSIECRWKTTSNNWVYLTVQKLQVLDQSPPEVILTAYNITDRKLLEAELQASEQQFRSLVLNIPGAAFRCDGCYTMGYMSDGIRAVSGYVAGDFINDRVRSFLSIVHPDDVERIEASIEAAMQDNHAQTLEYRIFHADGSVRWLAEKRQGVFYRGNLLWFDGILLDVTDRHQLQLQLQQSEALSRILLQASTDRVLHLSRQGDLLHIYSTGNTPPKLFDQQLPNLIAAVKPAIESAIRTQGVQTLPLQWDSVSYCAQITAINQESVMVAIKPSMI